MLKHCRQFLKAGIIQLILTASFLLVVAQQAGENQLSVVGQKQDGAFQLVAGKKAAPVYFDTADAMVVQIAAKAFVNDVGLVSGITPSLAFSTGTPSYGVFVGTIGQCAFIDHLIKNKKLNVSSIKRQWERFAIAVIENPFGRTGKALVVAGSDPRGTAFGIFELSKMMGVSPFCWWADVVPGHKEEIFATKGKLFSQPPSVKYRGIFLNDEDWGLQPWAAKTFEPETGDIGPKTYAKVFELMLRLKANLIWPAMHDCTKAFFTIAGNAKVAADYSIIIGSSHAEPMLRNNVGEWNEKTMGHFNYLTNQQTIDKYWEYRVKESSGINAMYTLGMRGVHDSQMEGAKDPKEAVPLLENIIGNQRNMLARLVNKNVETIPQVFTAYKEVLDIYDNGLKVPDDVTIVWPDDNYGYIQRLNNENEKKRSGASGVYYHASYWGRPHDYLWLGSTHPSLMRSEMMKAFASGANRLWVLNVGDIKPLEYNIEMFMEMAYDASPFKDSRYPKKHLLQWASSLFGEPLADMITPVLWEYYQLAFERRPEFMGWSQTEPTTKTTYTNFNHFYYGDEAQRRIDRYEALEQKVKALRTKIAPKDAEAFYELVYYPVIGASLMNKKFLYRDKCYFNAQQNRLSALDYAQLSLAAYDSIVQETNYYNNQLSGGKWKNMMSMKPRELPVFLAPALPQVTIDSSQEWGVAPEGFVKKDSSLLKGSNNLKLPPFDPLNRQVYFIDIFLCESKTLDWSASVSDPRIRLSKTSGRLTPEFGQKQMRLYASIDWTKAPSNKMLAGQITFTAGGKQVLVQVDGADLRLSENYQGFIENNGLVSIHASHDSRLMNKGSGDWHLLHDQGYTGEAMQSQAVAMKDTLHLSDTGWIHQNRSYIEYNFYSFSPADASAIVFTLPTHPFKNNYSMR